MSLTPNYNLYIYRKIKKETDLSYAIEQKLRSKLHHILRTKKENCYSELIGCIPKEFKLWLEFNFSNQMNWNNYGNTINSWSIDHRIPISSATNIDEIYKLNHYCNLQPMWHVDNIKKGKKIL